MQDSQLVSDVVAYNHDRYLSRINNLPFSINKDFERILNARYQKVSRIKKRLLYLVIRYKYIWFCTFTINNNFIDKCERTKRDYIKQYLNTHDFKYILNVDFGTKGTERQHYHCILATNIDMDVNQYFQSMLNDEYGWTKSLPCIKASSDLNRLTKYIDKLSNHCVKASTEQKRLYYNFKGYNAFCPNSKTVSLQYRLEMMLFENVTLLDKGDTTGKNELSILQNGSDNE